MCRGSQSLSCIDCGKDFWGDDYKNHVKCISEDQKYGGKGYEAKANKGDIKQQQWIQKVHDAMNKPGVSAKLKDVLQLVNSYGNVPRKRSKFQNWMRNSLNIANTGLHDEVWDILSAGDNNGNQDAEKKKKLNKRERKEARQQKSGKAVKTAEKTDAQEPGEGKKKKKDRKRKHSSEEEDEEQNGAGNETASKKTKTTDQEEDDSTEETEDQQVPKGKFNWKGNIKAVLAAYYTFTGDGNFRKEEEVLAIFNKKVTKNPKFRVLKERVRLIM
ncbi:Cell growth-regulating nucleolar protein [Dissostichus eleginoides]|uniref:Cell growth-regulating nucleolar protein n=1 Tax=Dissostichus eleginoides TaxID=100907 RepID=A0AAD9CHL4_DISEL|nr:Cell growth-regulating nucleolar protein [Dissostichus eleginoides]